MTPYRCRVCGELLDDDARSCPICLEPADRTPRRMTRAAMLRALVAVLLFFATLPPFLGPATRLADPMTLLDAHALPDLPFPIVVMTAGVPRIARERDAFHIAPPPPGSSFVVAAARAAEVQRRLNVDSSDGGWTLRVTDLGGGRERIELTFVNDGYRGSIYEATSTSIQPLQRRVTGPGFGIVFGEIALAMNAGVWLIVAIAWWLIRRRRRAA